MKTKTLKERATKSMRPLVVKRIGLLAVAMVFLLLVSIPANAGLKSEGVKEAPQFATGVIMVKFVEGAKVEMEKTQGYVGAGIASVDALNRKYGVREFAKVFWPEPNSGKGKTAYRELGLGRVYRFVTDPQADVQAMTAEYEADLNVEYAEPDYVGHGHFIPDDPNFGLQWGLHNTGFNPPPHPGTADADIDATEAWCFWAPEHVIILAILDTGLDIDHPDFWWSYPTSGVIWTNTPECSGTGGVDDDGNGYVDDCHGCDFVNSDGDPQDDHGHGTVNAGIAGALTNNNLGVAGLVGGPFNPYRIMAVKVLNSSNWGYYSWWESGLYYAANNGASVINMSMGGTSFSSTLQSAVNYAWGQGCVVVASMGNANSSTSQYPAAFTNSIAVGATDTDDSRCVPPDWQTFGMPSGGSNYGSHIDVVAPGNWIYSTVWNNSYGYWAGTSMAAPYVSGLAALIMSEAWPEPSPDSVRQIIRSTADDQVGLPGEDTPGWDQYFGWGRINAAKAIGVPTPLFAEDFDDCDITDWTVNTSSGTFATTSSQYVSPPCALNMYSQSTGYAYGSTPNLDLDTTQSFIIATYFMVPNTGNHWFLVLDNNWVHLVIDSGNQLRAWQGSNGGILHLANLNTNQWYYIKTVVNPGTSNYDIYLNCFYVATANFLRGGAGNVFSYLRLGDIHGGSTDHGEGYWDDLFVYGEKSYLCGDVNGDGSIDLGDVLHLIAYLYKNGPAPDPLATGDVDCSGGIDLGDVLYLIAYLYKNGPAPCSDCSKKAGGFSASTSRLKSRDGYAELSLLLETDQASGDLSGSSESFMKDLDDVSEISVVGKFDRDVAGVHLEIEFDPDEVTLLNPVMSPMTERLQLFAGVEVGTQKIGMVDLSGKNYLPAGEGTLVNLRAKGKDLTSIRIKEAMLLDLDAVPLNLELHGGLRFKESKGTESLPQHFSLSQNYPNPFNPQTSIRYALPQDAQVKLVIYNVLGQKIKTLVDEFQSAGHKVVWWDGKDERGDQVASGVYFYRLKADEFSEAKKMLLVK